MPERPVWFERPEILTFEEIVRFTRVAIGLGVTKVRLTGGEPLVRRDVVALVELLARLEGLEDLSLTTNGILLRRLAEPLFNAGLRRVNVSLDSLHRDRFEKLTRRDELDAVLAGIEAAAAAGFSPVKINVVMMKDVNVDEALAFAWMARTRPFHVRFLEYMPLDGQDLWRRDDVVTGAQVLEQIRGTGRLVPVPSDDPSEGRRGGDRLHQSRERALLRRLLEAAPHRRRDDQELPARQRRVEREAAHALGGDGRGDRRSHPARRGHEGGASRDQQARLREDPAEHEPGGGVAA
jgi:molybdenum cofactor biosynthesis enzyme MoaA